jgi:competence protein ComGF
MLTGLGSALTYWFQFGKIEERVDQLSKSFAKLEAIDTIKREEWKLFVEQVRNDLREIKEHQRRQ